MTPPAMQPALAFQFYRCGGTWRWRLTGPDGPIAVCKRGYATKRGAVKALQRFRGLPFGELPLAPIDAGAAFHGSRRQGGLGDPAINCGSCHHNAGDSL